MCLVHIWRVLFWRAIAGRDAACRVSSGLCPFCPAIFLVLPLSMATREACRVLTAKVYNEALDSVSVSGFRMQNFKIRPDQIHQGQFHQDAGEIR
jgi:hypothetical protein